MNETGRCYNPVGRTGPFTDQVKNSVQAMYERGYNDGKNDANDYMKNEYQRGYEDGRKSNEVTLKTDGTITAPSQSVLGVAAAAIADDKMGYKHGYDDGYQRGLDDMKNALLAIDKWNNVHKALVFNGSLGSIAILRNHNSKYIVDEVRKYQEEQAAQAAEIKVGDEVICDDVIGIVTFVNNQYLYLYVVCYDGSTGKWDCEDCERTGRHFDQIAEFLDKLKELKGGEV